MIALLSPEISATGKSPSLHSADLLVGKSRVFSSPQFKTKSDSALFEPIHAFCPDLCSCSGGARGQTVESFTASPGRLFVPKPAPTCQNPFKTPAFTNANVQSSSLKKIARPVNNGAIN